MFCKISSNICQKEMKRIHLLAQYLNAYENDE